MQRPRPDLSQLPDDVRAYIEALEAEVVRLRPRPRERERITTTEGAETEPSFDPSEPPTTLSLITSTAAGVAKRTPRHFYNRQRRGGMGVFDLDTPEEEPPAALVVVDEGETLLLISNLGRAYRLPLGKLPPSPVRSRGIPLAKQLLLDRGERIALMLPCPTSGYVALVNRTGEVRRFRHHTFRETMQPGTLLYSTVEFGTPAVACLTPGESDLFIATRQGRAIRFAEESIPVRGCPGIRLTEGDTVVAVTSVQPESGVFLLGADGKGTIRLMEGFGANKAPGAGGKSAMTTDHLVGAVTVDERDDLFAISRLGKIIRFAADEVPAKEGVVQGVHCLALRADEAMAVAVARVTP